MLKDFMALKPLQQSLISLVVSEQVSEKTDDMKNYQKQYQKNLVSEKSIGTGIGKICYRKKVSELVTKIFCNGTNFCRQN